MLLADIDFNGGTDAPLLQNAKCKMQRSESRAESSLSGYAERRMLSTNVKCKCISHDVFLETLSRVINYFITRDKALRGTLCNSAPNPSWAAGHCSISASNSGCGFYVGLKMQA